MMAFQMFTLMYAILIVGIQYLILKQLALQYACQKLILNLPLGIFSLTHSAIILWASSGKAKSTIAGHKEWVCLKVAPYLKLLVLLQSGFYVIPLMNFMSQFTLIYSLLHRIVASYKYILSACVYLKAYLFFSYKTFSTAPVRICMGITFSDFNQGARQITTLCSPVSETQDSDESVIEGNSVNGEYLVICHIRSLS